MRIAYIDCIAGASGDMLLGALVDLGVSPKVISDSITAMQLKDCKIEVKKVMKGALSATKINVITPQKETHRHFRDLINIIQTASISETVRARAIQILTRIASIEAEIHNTSLVDVHLHEVGGDDALIDIVGTLNCFEALNVAEIFVSPLPLTRGWVNSAHGQIPLPAPATLALIKGVPIYYLEDFQAELVTPTGTAILTSIADSFGSFPKMVLKDIGTGAGSMDLVIPNVIRIWLGNSPGNSDDLLIEKLMLLETNIDNMNGEGFGYLMETLMQAGALDVTFTPIQMKKNRPSVQVSVLCQPHQVEIFQDIIFKETPTLGIKQFDIKRTSIPRQLDKVSTPFGDIQIKKTSWRGKLQASPEYEDCRKAAKKHKVPIEDIIQTAQEIFLKTKKE
jgi:pyridinium-3,5-bisthiocarboxylic acid mononucleotide nickel chelatase